MTALAGQDTSRKTVTKVHVAIVKHVKMSFVLRESMDLITNNILNC